MLFMASIFTDSGFDLVKYCFNGNKAVAQMIVMLPRFPLLRCELRRRVLSHETVLSQPAGNRFRPLRRHRLNNPES